MIFAQNFDSFVSLLRGTEESPVSISPKKFGQALCLDMQTLAAQAHVHRNTISRYPEAESVQRFLRDSIKTICAAVHIAGNVENAIYWFKTYPLQPFDYKTPQEIVSDGNTLSLISYIDYLHSGFAG